MKHHSERVPGKNFRLLAGKPLYRWILDTLLSSCYVSEVIINTDSHLLLENYVLNGHPKVILRKRKPEICGDRVSMNKVIADDLQAYPRDSYLMTHATNPFISLDTLNKAIRSYYSNLVKGLDSLFSVNIHQTRMYDQYLSPVNHSVGELLRTQDLPPLYEENSCLYLFSQDSFMSTQNRIGRKPGIYATPKMESLDIDNQDDWSHAEWAAAWGQMHSGEKVTVHHEVS